MLVIIQFFPYQGSPYLLFIEHQIRQEQRDLRHKADQQQYE